MLVCPEASHNEIKMTAISAKGSILRTFNVIIGYELTGLSRGGQQVGKCQEVYAKAVKLLVELASLQVHVLAVALLLYRLQFVKVVYLSINF